jgi:hypothetical protein
VLGALPGIREIRSALAGGYLWITFFWLVLDPSLGEADFQSDPFQSAHHLGNEIGPVALGVGLTFIAYLVGTFFNELRGVLARLYLRARASASATAQAFRQIEFDSVEGSQASRKWLEQKLAEMDEQFAVLDPNRANPAGDKREAKPAQEPGLVGDMVEAIAWITRALGAGVAASASLVGSALNLGTFISNRVEIWLLFGVRRLIGLRLEPYKPFVSPHGVVAIERYLGERKNQLPDDLTPDVADVISDFPIVRIRLLQQSPDVVSEYDRLRAEADFRSSIVPPLTAIAVLLACEVSAWWLLALLLLVVLLGTARVRRREAGDGLADTLGAVEAPSVESHFRPIPQG